MHKKQRFWTIDDFDVGSVIGEGRFGKVFIAREKKSKFLCVLKILQKSKLKKHKLETQLISEIEIHSNFNNRNIVRLYGYFFDEERIMMILEYAARGSLADIIVKFNKLDEHTASKYFKQIVSAVSCIHKHDVIHRDLKPSNVLVSLDNTMMLSDFGFAIKGTPKPGSCVGTLYYIAPEVLSGKSYDKAADIWSLGVILYELVVGKTPFENEDQRKTAENIQSANYKMPNSISPLLKSLISRILILDDKSRPSADDILADPWIMLQSENFLNSL